MKYIVSINDKNYEVEVERGEATIVKTTQAIHAEIASSTVPSASPITPMVSAPAAVNSVAVGEGEAIKAPLPGTILGIKVNAGASVKRGEILLILEAMKMENEIVAPRDGVVTQIVANKGSTVNTGDLLMMLK
ncbi:MAG TPA: biotin/lipoyl-containing protein [Ruminiclostridium sp.]